MKPQEAMQLLSGEAENSGLQIRQQSDELHPVSSKGAGSGAGKTYTEAEINLAQSLFLCDASFLTYSLLLASMILRKKYSSSG